jgi:hypothetical protein
MAVKNSAAKMNKREDSMRNPKNTGTVRGKGPKLVIAIGMAPTMKKNGGK